MHSEPTASNLECAMFVLLMVFPALLNHGLRYSSDRLWSLAVKRFKARGAPEKGVDSAILHEVVARMQGYRFDLSTLALDWLAFMALPVSMWVGVRLMDAGLLRSLWPWAVILGCLVMGVFNSRSQSLCGRRMDGLLDQAVVSQFSEASLPDEAA